MEENKGIKHESDVLGKDAITTAKIYALVFDARNDINPFQYQQVKA